MKTLVQTITGDSPVQDVYIPIEGMETYFQSQGVQPVAAATEMGILDQYNLAKKESGGDIKVSLADYANKVIGTPHWQGLQNDIKFNPGAQTLRQAQEESLSARAELEAVNNETKRPPINKINPAEATSEQDLMSMLGTRQRAERFIEYTQKRIDEKSLDPMSLLICNLKFLVFKVSLIN